MIDSAVTCCFTGHRPEKMPWRHNESDLRCIELKTRLYDAVEAVYLAGMRHFICGMAPGSDIYFCETVILLRDEYPDVTLEAAIPWEGQANRWRAELRKRYFRLLSECDYQTVITSQYSADCMMRRNRYMVDNSSTILAIYGGSPGGTMNTLQYAMRRGLAVIELPIFQNATR